MHTLVSLHITLLGERLATLDALIRLVVGVGALVVTLQGPTLGEGMSTDVAHEWLLSSVFTQVDEEDAAMGKELATVRTREWRFDRPVQVTGLLRTLCSCQ